MTTSDPSRSSTLAVAHPDARPKADMMRDAAVASEALGKFLSATPCSGYGHETNHRTKVTLACGEAGGQRRTAYLFEVTDLYESAGTWGFKFEGCMHRVRPPARAIEFEVADVYIACLGQHTLTHNCFGMGSAAELYVALHGMDSLLRCVLVVLDMSRERWEMVRKAVRVRPYILHWLEETAKRAEMARIDAARRGERDPDALF